MSTTKTLTAMAVAGAVATALTMTAAPKHAGAQDMEKCYGVALKGQNDCKAGAHDCKGMSTVDYDGQSFKLVAMGSCTAMQTPEGPGALEPIKRPS
ncbi:BufA1 family periplasmic bufferin-type metallophore [Microbaculum sp. FT89]|uniref:BufA1 family periplasmic bufferin-type metallophore n=1 Tax=Microbaculum sp. FT89 TaxID=3447298 RepID=UPI003F53E544